SPAPPGPGGAPASPSPAPAMGAPVAPTAPPNALPRAFQATLVDAPARSPLLPRTQPLPEVASEKLRRAFQATLVDPDERSLNGPTLQLGPADPNATAADIAPAEEPVVGLQRDADAHVDGAEPDDADDHRTNRS